MVQTRTRSVSDTKALPTHGLGLFPSRSNSATSSGDHADLSAFSACLSNIVRAMAFLQVSRSSVPLPKFASLCGTFVGGRLNRHARFARYIATFVGQEMGSRQLRKGSKRRAL